MFRMRNVLRCLLEHSFSALTITNRTAFNHASPFSTTAVAARARKVAYRPSMEAWKKARTTIQSILAADQGKVGRIVEPYQLWMKEYAAPDVKRRKWERPGAALVRRRMEFENLPKEEQEKYITAAKAKNDRTRRAKAKKQVRFIKHWIDWLIDWLMDGLVDWLIHSFIHSFIVWSIGGLIDWLIFYLCSLQDLPKKALSPYNFFVKERFPLRPIDMESTDYMAALAVEFHMLNDEQRSRYEEMSREEKNRTKTFIEGRHFNHPEKTSP